MWLLSVFLLFQVTPAQPRVSTCVQCHQELDSSPQSPVELAKQDVHFQKGFSCHSCHGGDPTLGVDRGEPKDSMDPAKGYIGVPSRAKIAALCASCHSKLDFMRRFNPQARVDQYAEYRTSVHGKKNQAGDLNVATCIDCHGAHGVKAVSDPTGPVYPTNVTTTCARCHSDAKKMSGYKIPTNQMALYEKSVHGEALIKNRDISAPTCNDCHGNHGAVPPGVDSVANVCWQCHVSQWELFDKSPHKAPFAESQFPACATCHEHHGVQRTSDEMLGVEESATCVSCHEKGSAGYLAGAEMKRGIVGLRDHLESAHEVLARAERAGMEVSRASFELAEGRDRLVRARVEIHRFDKAELQKLVDEGMRIAASSQQGGRKALSELVYRRKGLAVSVVILLCMMTLLIVKIRQMER